jgi:hypothetical protein
MPKQETVFEQKTTDKRIEVLKVYDRNYARQAFESMDEAAQKYLWSSLGINESYNAADLPPMDDPASEDFLWEELLDAAREDGNLLSFFVVNEGIGSISTSLYVSPDWPSAEAFAKGRLELGANDGDLRTR